MEHFSHIWVGSPQVSLTTYVKVQMRLRDLMLGELLSTLQPLFHRRNVASLWLFYIWQIDSIKCSRYSILTVNIFEFDDFNADHFKWLQLLMLPYSNFYFILFLFLFILSEIINFSTGFLYNSGRHIFLHEYFCLFSCFLSFFATVLLAIWIANVCWLLATKTLFTRLLSSTGVLIVINFLLFFTTSPGVKYLGFLIKIVPVKFSSRGKAYMDIFVLLLFSLVHNYLFCLSSVWKLTTSSSKGTSF